VSSLVTVTVAPVSDALEVSVGVCLSAGLFVQQRRFAG